MTSTALTDSLLLSDVRVTGIEIKDDQAIAAHPSGGLKAVKSDNVFTTFMQKSLIDLSNGLDFLSSKDISVE
jgi:hypothetical protein